MLSGEKGVLLRMYEVRSCICGIFKEVLLEAGKICENCIKKKIQSERIVFFLKKSMTMEEISSTLLQLIYKI